MEDDRWIDAQQRRPGPDDADVFNCVLVYHQYNGAMVTGYRQFDMNPMLTHWMPLPKPPRCYRDRHGTGHKK